MNTLKVHAKGIPLNSTENESTNSDSCNDNEEVFEVDDSNDF